jgi:RimJ/RimL family protein N-acetyltransferase
MIGDKAYWNRGYGTDVVDTLLDHLFSDLEMEMVYLHTLAWNERAQSSFAKSGFREARPVRKGGQDFIRMEIKKDEWQNCESDPF